MTKSSFISVKIAGSSIVGGILCSTPSAIFLIVPLKIFPDLVFGNLFITITTLNAATGPILSLTIWTHSLDIVSLFLSTPDFKTTIVVKRLPKTRSGKILRGTVRKIADKEEYKMPATIDDPAILDEIKQDLIKNNILK